MIDPVAAAFERGDYKTAARLLKPLFQASPEDPWVQLYIGRLQEVYGRTGGAERTYRQLLRSTISAKIALEAHQGLQRLETTIQARQLEAPKVDQPKLQSAFGLQSGQVSFLVLEPIAGVARSIAVGNFAQIMNLDLYTAQLQLPSRSWRLYRIGEEAELQAYQHQLLQVKIPALSIALAKLEEIQVFRVRYLQAISPQATVVCENAAGQLGTFTFDWSEVAGRVDGALPIFEDVLDRSLRKKLQRKEQTSDYARVCDLHLPARQCILRFCDLTYEFQQDIRLKSTIDRCINSPQTTTRINWNNLINHISSCTKAAPAWSGFTAFAETALEHLERINDFKSHIDLFRKAETNWDRAFQLYSGLVFLKP